MFTVGMPLMKIRKTVCMPTACLRREKSTVQASVLAVVWAWPPALAHQPVAFRNPGCWWAACLASKAGNEDRVAALSEPHLQLLPQRFGVCTCRHDQLLQEPLLRTCIAHTVFRSPAVLSWLGADLAWHRWPAAAGATPAREQQARLLARLRHAQPLLANGLGLRELL